jgi:putative membrane protein insertion efficiency factor
MLARLLIGGISLYRRWISPLLPQSCRFYPSCSEYAVQAIESHGGFEGAGLALRRVARCHPWSAGGPDPVPGRHA